MTAGRPDKPEQRRRVGSALAGIDPGPAAAAATARLLDLVEVRAARTVAAYAAIAGELPTRPLIDALRARGCRVLLPALLPDATLAWRVYDGRPLVAGPRGTLEPPADAATASLAEADVALVPGVAFDATGRRLGRGGGSYDRALATARPPFVVALAADEQVLGAVPTEPHDEPVDAVVTPTRVLRRPAG